MYNLQKRRTRMRLVVATLILVLALVQIATQLQLVQAQPPQPTLTLGLPVDLERTVEINANDAIAPHLYDWYFDHINDIIEVPHRDSFYSDKISIEFLLIYVHRPRWWVSHVIKDGSWRILTNMEGDSLQVSVFSLVYNGWWSLYAPPKILKERVFHHVVGVIDYDGSNTHLHLYVDGLRRAYTYFSGGFAQTTNPIKIQNLNGNMYMLFVRIYNRPLSGSEIYGVYAYNVVNALNLTLFLDPTFYNGTHYIDLSGKGNHALGYCRVTRAISTKPFIHIIKGLYSDGLVHFKFFPPGTRIEVYDTGGSNVATYIVSGSVNQVGLIEDYAVSLQPGNYTLKVRTAVSTTVYQNHGTTRYTYIARFMPGSLVRLQWNVNGVVQAHYQIATDSGFTNIVQEAVIPVSTNFVDVQVPGQIGTYYVRVRVADAGGVWSSWSNTVMFKVDRLKLEVSLSDGGRTNVSKLVNLLITTTYTDGSSPAVLSAQLNATLTQLGAWAVADAIWRVDVYQGCDPNYEPPGPGYTYKGTVYPIMSHSYFASRSTFTPPDGYGSFIGGFVLRNLLPGEVPYWMSGFGLTSCFALVYSTQIYLPLSGTYTFEVRRDAGARVYVDGVLVLDDWREHEATRTPRSTVSLSSGWHHIVVKYRENIGDRTLIVRLTLPDGTVIKPLIPVQGVQMKPEGDAKPYIPSTPLSLVYPNYTLVISSGSSPQLIDTFTLSVVGRVNISLRVTDHGLGWVTETKSVLVTWDLVLIRGVFVGEPAKPLTLQSTFSIKPGDVITPHLYDWLLRGANDRVQASISPSLSNFNAKTVIMRFKVLEYTASWTLLDSGYWADPYGDVLRGSQMVIEYHLRNTGGTSATLTYDVPSAYRYSWLSVTTSWSGSTAKLYVNGSEVTSTGFTGTLACSAYPLTIGSRYDGSGVFKGLISNLLVYRRGLSDTEISDINYNVVNALNLTLFLDPTFYNGTHYIDLSGKGNHAQGYRSISRVPAENPHLYIVKGLHSDGLVHFKFFPPGTRIEVYDSMGNLVTTFTIRGEANQVGLVEDYTVSPVSYTHLTLPTKRIV